MQVKVYCLSHSSFWESNWILLNNWCSAGKACMGIGYTRGNSLKSGVMKTPRGDLTHLSVPGPFCWLICSSSTDIFLPRYLLHHVLGTLVSAN